MFSRSEIDEVMALPSFEQDLHSVKQSLVNRRSRQPAMLVADAGGRLAHFAEAVLCSAPNWLREERLAPCRAAAEALEVLAGIAPDLNSAKRMRVRAALLYDLADMPGLAGAVVQAGDAPPAVVDLFKREGSYRVLNGSAPQMDGVEPSNLIGEFAYLDDSARFAVEIQDPQAGLIDPLGRASAVASRVAAYYDLGLSATELRAFDASIAARAERATVRAVDPTLSGVLRGMRFPAELLPAQKAALGGGLLDPRILSWGFAAPTGSGKTYLARLLIADVLRASPDTKVVYLVPSKALVTEVAGALGESLRRLDVLVLALSAQLVDLEEREKLELDDASVVVMTPEKADMLLRLKAEFLQAVSVVVVDEAHHLESGTRGALLELYLWRLKRLLPKSRFVFLSAVAPNVLQIARWLDEEGKAVTFNTRPTRMRVGVYKVVGTGVSARSRVEYSDGTSIVVVGSRAETAMRRGICELAQFLQQAGPVLIVAKGKKECEKIAEALKEWLAGRGELRELSDSEKASEVFGKLDASLEREMYADVELRSLIKCRIAYHHAGLPPNVRRGVEDAIRQRQVDYVVATTTLAEGVNFPFSSVVVQSLALREPPEAGRPSRYAPVTPRAFWNIAGRAGRLGFDTEGQVVLFEPSLGLEHIDALLQSYLQPDLTSLSPVGSALADAFRTIEEELDEEAYTQENLQDVRLPEAMSKRARGAINLVRVGITHARATGLIQSPEEIVDGSFAARFLSAESLDFARTLVRSQDAAIQRYLAQDESLNLEKLAELGLSLETLTELREYVQRMDTWQIKNCEKLFYGGTINLEQAQYIVGPVAKRMAEMEGPTLGGFLSDVIVQWLSGVTFTSIKKQAGFAQRLEDLIAVIYSRVQFLLPWGLWATDWLIEEEAKKRDVNYENPVRRLAYLADAGVPSFDALHLFHLQFERVDATRLSHAYHRSGGTHLGTDCLGWILGQSNQNLARIIAGTDGRRIEYGFFERMDSLRAQ